MEERGVAWILLRSSVIVRCNRRSVHTVCRRVVEEVGIEDCGRDVVGGCCVVSSSTTTTTSTSSVSSSTSCCATCTTSASSSSSARAS